MQNRRGRTTHVLSVCHRLSRSGPPTLLAIVMAMTTLVIAPYALAKVYKCFGHRATQVGTEGVDVITGTPGKDVIVGLGGNDKIVGRVSAT